MPQKVGVIIEFSTRKKEELKKIIKDTERLGGTVRKLAKTTEASTKKMGAGFTFLAWHFRYLGNIFDRVGQQMIRVLKDVIKTSAELQESFLSIRTAAVMYGESAERATWFTKNLALTGLMPLAEAANAVKNLMITGLGLPELEKFTYRYLDVAFLFTSGADEMTKSLETMSKSILRGTLVLSTDVAARTLWVETEKRLQRTIGLSMKELNANRRALELLTTIETKYADTLGFHRMEMETTRAAMTRMNAAITMIKDAFGTALLPILNLVGSALAKTAIYVTSLVEALGSVIPTVVAVSLVVVYFTAKLSFLIGVILSFVKIAAFAGIALWKIYLPLLAVGAVLAVGTYLILRYTGALDKAKQSMANIDAQLKKLEESLSGVSRAGEEGIGIEEDRRIAHERTVEDIEEDLDREVSKGLWANQMAIRDLKKRLARENEDWARYVKGRGKAEEAGEKTIGNVFDKIFNNAEGAAEKLGKLDWFKSIISQAEGAKMAIAALVGVIGGLLALSVVRILAGWIVKLLAANTAVGFLAGSASGLAGTLAAIAAVLASPFVLIMTVIGAAAVGAILWKVRELENTIDGLTKSIITMSDLQMEYLDRVAEKFGKQSKEYREAAESILRDTENVRRAVGEISEPLGWGGLWESTKKVFGVGTFPGMLMKQFGGIVPGMRNQAIPIMAHGGERVIPAGEVAGGGNITININNPSVRSDNDIREIARQVSEAMGQRQKFSRLGSF